MSIANKTALIAQNYSKLTWELIEFVEFKLFNTVVDQVPKSGVIKLR